MMLERLLRTGRTDDRCWLVTPNSPVLQPESAECGIGSLSLNLFLLAAVAQADRELQRRTGPLHTS